MAVQGIFQADFSSFYDAVQKAEVQLKSFESGAGKVESSLSRMTDSFSGRKLITEAQLMAEVLERAGGASKFTEAELARMGSTGAAAAAKMMALGMEVPAGIQKLADVTKNAGIEQNKLLDTIGQSGGRLTGLSAVTATTNTSVSSLATSYRQFDGVLVGMGVNIGAQVKAFEDLVAASNKSAASIGMMGTVGLVLATAMAAWAVGRKVADFLDLDKAIANTTARMQGFGDVVAQEAGAKADVLAFASRNAGRAITDMGEAMRVNADWVKTHGERTTSWTGMLAAAQREVRNLTDSQIRDIEIAQQAGATTEQLTSKFHISAAALKVLAERHRDAAKATEEHEAKTKALDAAYARLNSQIANEKGMAQFEAAAAALARQAENVKQLNMMEAAAWQAEKARIDEQTAAEVTAEAQRIAANQREIDALLAVKTQHEDGAKGGHGAANETIAGYQGVAAQITLTGDAIREYINLMRYTAQVNAINAENSLFTTASQRDRIANLPNPSSFGSNLPAGASIGGGSQTFNQTFQIVDTESNIARRVSAQILQTVKSGTQLGFA